ncbi:ATP-grasp domain-containing protein [Frigoriglobus tundricola]|uniref:Tyramine--L-glutamate ligase n=1 Tax=Frigoriglobus tundricola TaxID=2774151 RepID=A0A6M5Z164_9BACT|nr:ATP-grasp domain-containing protein [Frigoriglobus tundricola]QJW99895.1 Tyramine--L-glutamate ligase [Frigoriglobus tundricola]
MRVFVYEHLTAAGIGRDPDSPEHGMYREGHAMRDAVAADFARVPGVEVVTLDRFEGADPGHEIRRVAERCDWALVIAPETDGQMDRDCWAVRASGCRLLGSSPGAIRATTDKLALAERWRGHGVRTPATTEREPTVCEAFPVVWKPRDGAGSTDTFLIRDRFELARAQAARDPDRPMVLQEFIPGQPASVAFLCGAGDRHPLLPGYQLLSDDGRFKYRGGELPLPPAQAERVTQLARRALACVPELLGYVGVDLVLGDAEDGSRDFAIEINPRLTTSYIGLRALADFNIAEAMLRGAQGERPEAFRWKPGRVRFGPDGTVAAA